MALFSLDVQKAVGGVYFTNRYILEGAAVTSFDTAAMAIVQAEQAIMLAQVSFISYRVSDAIVGNDQYIVVPLSLQGLRVGGAEALPLFCCARVDFQVAIGRPSRKYLRGVLVEGDQSAYGLLNATVVSFINENYTAYVVAQSEFVDVDGQNIVSGGCIANVAMRQLRRGSKRRLTPIIPVS